MVPGVNGKCLDMCDLHEAVEKKRNLPPLFIYNFTIKQHYDMENYCIFFYCIHCFIHRAGLRLVQYA